MMRFKEITEEIEQNIMHNVWDYKRDYVKNVCALFVELAEETNMKNFARHDYDMACINAFVGLEGLCGLLIKVVDYYWADVDDVVGDNFTDVLRCDGITTMMAFNDAGFDLVLKQRRRRQLYDNMVEQIVSVMMEYTISSRDWEFIFSSDISVHCKIKLIETGKVDSIREPLASDGIKVVRLKVTETLTALVAQPNLNSKLVMICGVILQECDNLINGEQPTSDQIIHKGRPEPTEELNKHEDISTDISVDNSVNTAIIKITDLVEPRDISCNVQIMINGDEASVVNIYDMFNVSPSECELSLISVDITGTEGETVVDREERLSATCNISGTIYNDKSPEAITRNNEEVFRLITLHLRYKFISKIAENIYTDDYIDGVYNEQKGELVVWSTHCYTNKITICATAYMKPFTYRDAIMRTIASGKSEIDSSSVRNHQYTSLPKATADPNTFCVTWLSNESKNFRSDGKDVKMYKYCEVESELNETIADWFTKCASENMNGVIKITLSTSTPDSCFNVVYDHDARNGIIPYGQWHEKFVVPIKRSGDDEWYGTILTRKFGLCCTNCDGIYKFEIVPFDQDVRAGLWADADSIDMYITLEMIVDN